MTNDLAAFASRINRDIDSARASGQVVSALTTEGEEVIIREVRAHGDRLEARTEDGRWVPFMWYNTARR